MGWGSGGGGFGWRMGVGWGWGDVVGGGGEGGKNEECGSMGEVGAAEERSDGLPASNI